MTSFDRRTLLATGGLALVHRSLPFPAQAPAAAELAARGEPAVPWPSFPGSDPEIVSRFVGASHADLETVEEVVRAHPALARASWDWGFGDWESALGAASHMGNREIAEVLIAHGARPNLFTSAMMGDLAVVKAMIEARPGVQRIPGPHGITLLSHARAGGEPAAAVHEYLEGLGDADLRPPTVELTAEERQRFVGTYRFGRGADDYAEVAERRELLNLRFAGYEFGRNLFPVSATEFYPAGAAAVRIAFEMGGDVARGFRIVDGDEVLRARRQIGAP